MEELYESDVMWSGDYDHQSSAEPVDSGPSIRRMNGNRTAPVEIPAARGRSERECYGEDEEVGDGWGELIPPHVMVSRSRMVGKLAFSLCSGHGRTLKGRDLSYVRDSVLRMTGFLEG